MLSERAVELGRLIDLNRNSLHEGIADHVAKRARIAHRYLWLSGAA